MRLIDWLRADLRRDLDALREYGPREYARALVDTLLAGGLLARSTAYSVVYAINHAEPGAETTVSLFAPPIRADCWRARDELQAGVVAALPLALFATPFASVPTDPVVAIVVAQQLGVLAAAPGLAMVEVVR